MPSTPPDNAASRLLAALRSLNRSPFWLAGVYVALASIWIFASDAIVVRFTGDAATAALWQTVKGVLFVAITGTLLYELIVLHDIALQNEQRRSEEQRRMASLGQLSATIAHEFNNVLMISSTSLEILQRIVDTAGPGGRAVSNIDQAQRRGARLVSEILRFGRPAEPVLRSTNVSACVRQFASENERIAAPASVVADVPEQPVLAIADGDLLQQALTNLVLNARDAASSRITLRVREAGAQVILSVIDDGFGIHPEDRPRIFEPMYTTKRNGTGLGLAVVYQIVTAHHGSIEVESGEGKGTSFRITLPAAAGR
jgi:signal transduction histidine kinase